MNSRERQRERRRENRHKKYAPLCSNINCAGHREGKCMILKNNHFGDKVCPFYKTAEQNEKEKKAVMARLIALDRQDLIDTYYGGKEGGVSDGC